MNCSKELLMKKLLIGMALLITNVSWSALDVKFGTIAPGGTPWADSLEEIKVRVNAESKGEMKVKVYLGGQLGGELEIMQKIRRGKLSL